MHTKNLSNTGLRFLFDTLAGFYRCSWIYQSLIHEFLDQITNQEKKTILITTCKNSVIIIIKICWLTQKHFIKYFIVAYRFIGLIMSGHMIVCDTNYPQHSLIVTNFIDIIMGHTVKSYCVIFASKIKLIQLANICVKNELLNKYIVNIYKEINP